MLFSKFLLTSLVGAASAVSIPKGTEEGVYDHHVDANGNDVFVKLANATNYSGKEPSPYSPKPFAGRFKREETAHCSPGPELDHRDTDAANLDLDWQCDHYDPTQPRHSFFAIRGGVVAFFCNFSFDHERKCSSASRRRESGLITQKCDWYRPGFTTSLQDSTKYGYSSKDSFCQ